MANRTAERPATRPKPRFSPTFPPSQSPAGIHHQGHRPRRPLRPAVRRLHRLPRAARGPDGERLDPDRGARHLGAEEARRLDHPREQHRPDHRLGRRIGRRRRGLHASRRSSSCCRYGPAYFNYLQITHAHPRRRHPRRADDGAAAARADREGARRAALSRRHGVRRGAGRRRARRQARRAGVQRASASARCGSRCRGSSTCSAPTSATRCRAPSQFPNATLNVDISPEYLGVGYVIGPRIAGTMFAGGVLSWLVLLPLLSILGSFITEPFPPIHPNFANNPATGRPFLISEMAPGQLWSAYIRYIGAGAVLASGLITLARTIPTIVSSARGSLKDLSAPAPARQRPARTERDIPMAVVLGGSLLLGDLPGRHAGPADAGQRRRRGPHPRLRLLLRHRLVAHHRAHRLLVEPDLGHDDRHADPDVPALRRRSAGRATSTRRSRSCVGAIVCIAAANAGTTSQDLKTGYIVGATPPLSADRPDHRRRSRLGVRDRHDDALHAPGVRHRIGGGAGAAGDADVHDHHAGC